MQENPKTDSKNEHLELFWDNFYKDQIVEAKRIAEDYSLSEDLVAKCLLKQGRFKQAYEILARFNDSGLIAFTEFLLNGDLHKILSLESDDLDTKIYQAQAIFLTRIYWGEDFLKSNQYNLDPDLILEEVFSKLIESKNYDKAILTSIQAIELLSEEQVLSSDLHLPIIEEQIKNLLALADHAKYPSTKAKIFLTKAKIFGDRQAAEDAEILFGKDKNTNGLAEVYLLYAREFNEDDYYEKALNYFKLNDNIIAQAFIYEDIAGKTLLSGMINEAGTAFDKAKELLDLCGIFEKYGLEIQRISLLAIRGKYQNVKEAIHNLIRPKVPPFFIAQAYQILANTIIQLGEDLSLAKGYIESASNIFRQLKRYNQLLYSLNIQFQILMFDDNLTQLIKLGEEIIQLASRLGNEEIKATKYLELSIITIRHSIEQNTLDQEKVDQANDYFNKAIKLYRDQDNALGEADAHQAVGNLHTSLGKLEEALKSFLAAKKIYDEEKAFLQGAITDSLIGILLLNYAMLNEQTYAIASKHLEHALFYFNKENILDLNWKMNFYLAELNFKFYLLRKESGDKDLYRNKAKTYFLEMLCAVEEYQKDAPYFKSQESMNSGISLEEAFNRAYQFFLSIDDNDSARKFGQERN